MIEVVIVGEGPTEETFRLKALLKPRFEKVLHGPVAAAHIGLDRIRVECKHFGNWLARIERLRPL